MLMGLSSLSLAQNTANDGDWKQRKVVKANTPEAELMIRLGDIDNLGFGWQEGYDPFSGKETEAHAFPWEQEKGEVDGLDRILLPTSLLQSNGAGSCYNDGYSASLNDLKARHNNINTSIKIPIERGNVQVKNVTLMMFIDDFQAPVFCSKFQVKLNGRRAPFLENVLNQVNQTGPIGKLITVKVPADFVAEFQKPQVELLIDDPITKPGDGFAIDFVKVLINPKGIQRAGLAKGILIDKESRQPVVGATVSIEGFGSSMTNEKGEFSISGVPVGLNVVQVCALKYRGQAFQMDIIEKQSENITLELDPQ